MRALLLGVAGLVGAALGRACALDSPSHGNGGFGTGGTTSSSSTGGGGSGPGGGPKTPTCTDGIENGDETDVDCGGSCVSCEIGQTCVTALDCVFDCVGHRCIAEPQSRWTDAVPNPMPAPPMRDVQAVAYDAKLARTILFGGLANNNNALGDTWSYDGNGWALANDGTMNAPPARFFAAMVYDEARANVVLFGGQNSFESFADTWVYSATGWSLVPASANGPTARSRVAMAYDSGRKVSVVFGGYNGSPLDETWEFDGATWTMATPTMQPLRRYDAAAAFDPANKRVIIYGGVGDAGTGSPLSDTWSWDGHAWQELEPSVPTPGPRSGVTMTTDTRRKRVILFGGSDGAGFHGDTWEWDGAAWMLAPTSLGPASTALNPIVFDDSRQRAVLYLAWDGVGFPGQTWEYDVLAVPCTKDTDCGSNSCQDGLCCAAKCGVCAACNLRDAPGQCDVVTGREDPDTCSGDHTCDASGKCVPK